MAEQILSRRTFLKAGLSGIAVFTLGGTALVRPVRGSAGDAGEYVSLTTGRLFHGTPTSCGMCPAGCGLLAFTDAGELIGLAGNPQHPYNRGAVCALGSASLNLVGSPQRVRAPCRRRGDRGQGHWEKLSWEQAMGELTDALRQSLDGRARGPLAVCVPERARSPFLDRFVSFFPDGSLDVADGHELGVERAVAGGPTDWAWKGTADFENAELILNFGANPLGSVRHLLGTARPWADGARRGARWITIDPRLSETANASHEWVPIRPGTDGPFACALAHEIVKNGWGDRSALEGVEDSDRSRMEGSVRDWTPDLAGRVCGVSADRIRRIALEFAAARGAAAIFGRGVTARRNGERDARLILLLDCLTGNIDRKGGYRLIGTPPWKQPGSQILGHGESPSAAGLFWALGRGRRQVGTLITCEANPAVSDPDSRGTVEVLRDPRKVPYHAAMATVWNETARLADLVLPAAPWLGRWGLHRGACPTDGSTWVGMRQPVLRRQGDETAPEEILLRVVGGFGAGADQAFPFQDMEAYYRAVLQEGWPGVVQEPRFDTLQRQGFILVPGDAGRRKPSLNWRALRFPEVELVVSDNPDPETSVRKEVPDCERTLLLYGSPMQEADAAPCAWIEEIDHARPLWVHPGTAAEIGCVEGDWVRIRGPAGEIRTRVRLTQGIHPEAVAMRGTAMGGIPEGDRPWWWEQVYGEDVRKIIPWPSDPLREGPGWEDTRVSISKYTV